MKTYYLFFMALLCFSQYNEPKDVSIKNNNITKHNETDFFIENKQLYWEKVYTSNINDSEKLQEEIVKEIIKNPLFTITNNQPGIIRIEKKESAINLQKYGRKLMHVAIFCRYKNTFTSTIEFKEGRYKVKTQNIEFVDETNIYTNFPTKDPLELFILKNKKSEFRENSTVNDAIKLIDSYLFDEHDFFKKESKTDW